MRREPHSYSWHVSPLLGAPHVPPLQPQLSSHQVQPGPGQEALQDPPHVRQDGLPDRQHCGLRSSALLWAEHALLLHFLPERLGQLVVIRALGHPPQEVSNSEGVAEVLQHGVPEAGILHVAVVDGQTSLRGASMGGRGG